MRKRGLAARFTPGPLTTCAALTGLGNRTLLIDRIARAFAERSTTSTGLIFVDLDGFKEINDTPGHAAGDAVLRQIAGRLKKAVRPMDSVSRLGGGEFVVLLPAPLSTQDAISVADRIASDVVLPITLEHGSVAVTASVGVFAGFQSTGAQFVADVLFWRVGRCVSGGLGQRRMAPRLVSASDHNSSLPARSAATVWRLDRFRIQAAAGD